MYVIGQFFPDFIVFLLWSICSRAAAAATKMFFDTFLVGGAWPMAELIVIASISRLAFFTQTNHEKSQFLPLLLVALFDIFGRYF